MLLHWKLALYHSSIHLHKCSIVCIDFSLLKYFVKGHGYLKKWGYMKVPQSFKKMWAHGGPLKQIRG
jgi:hypothetical protein